MIRGVKHFECNELALAQKDLLEAVVHDPAYDMAALYLSRIYLGRKDPMNARKWLNHALQFPASPFRSVQRGYVYIELGLANEALEELNQVIKKKPDYSEALAVRGRTYFQLKNYDKAKEDLLLSIKQRPNAYAHLLLGQLFLVKKEYQQAIDHFTAALDREKSNLAYSRRGEAYRMSDGANFQRSLADFEKALAIDPKDCYSLSREAEIYFRWGKGDRAWKSLNRALELNPEHPFALQVIGRVFNSE